MRRLAVLFLLLASSLRADATVIAIDYSLDATNFFGSNPVARAAVEAAAQDLNNAIVSALGAVTTDTYTGTNGGTTATFDWNLSFTNPSTGSAVTQESFSAPAGQITLYVGLRPLTGVTLGIGGPAGGGFGFTGSGQASEWIGAVAAAESASNAAMPRGGGPVMGTLSGSSTLGGTTANYSLRYGAIAGSLSFDSDSDNNAVADSPGQLDAYWHYDHTTAVAAGKNDLYSVALHEMLHAIGVGTSDTWLSLASGMDWTGANVIALNGTGVGMVSADGGHIADGAMSTRLSDGAAQEAVMDPSITQGTRKYLTQLDLAFLRDLNFATVPEPSSTMLLAGASLALLLVRRRKIAASNSCEARRC